MVPLTPFSVNTEVILCVPGLLLRTLHVVMSFVLGAIDPLMLVRMSSPSVNEEWKLRQLGHLLKVT